MDFSADYWGPISTLSGAFIGAFITGIIAIRVNKSTEKARLKERQEKIDKINHILNFYLEEVKENLIKIISVYEEFNSYISPWELYMETGFDDEGNEVSVSYPPEEVIEEFEKSINPLKKEYLNTAQSILKDLEKITNVDLFSLEVTDIKSFLEILAEIKRTHLPYFERVNKDQIIETPNKGAMQFLIHKINIFNT